MRVMLVCEATETSKRSKMESHHLMGYYAPYIKLCYTILIDGDTILSSVG